MKIKIAYSESERADAEKLAEVCSAQMSRDGSVKRSSSDRHKPFYHIYLSKVLTKPKK